MVSPFRSSDDRAIAWCAAASFAAHVALAMALTARLRASPAEPSKPEVADVDVSQGDSDDESAGLGANPASPAEVAARPHAARAGRSPREQSQREAHGAKAARPAARTPRTPVAPDDMHRESPRLLAMLEDSAVQRRSPEGPRERAVDGKGAAESSAPQRDVPAWNAGLPAGAVDPLDHVLEMRAERNEREQAGERAGVFAPSRSARTGPETTVVVSSPAFADGASLIEGFGAGTGGRGRSGPDKSSRARLGGPVWWWFCPWPHDADALPIRHAAVKLVVAVRADGHATAARVVEDSPEFGAGARQCAMDHVYIAARDRDGRVVEGTTMPFVVKFDR
jgi:hypothetical protein